MGFGCHGNAHFTQQVVFNFPHKPCTYINIVPEHALIATSGKMALRIFTFAQMRAGGGGRRVSLRKFAVPLLIKQSATCNHLLSDSLHGDNL